MYMGLEAKEYIWGCELTGEKKEVKWDFEEEDDDTEFLQHTLFLKHAALASGAKKDERNLVVVSTKNFDGEVINQTLVSLSVGVHEMCTLDISFGQETIVTFKLVEGSGPVHLTGQHMVEFPEEYSDEESQYETEDLTEDEVEQLKKDAKNKKRKANTPRTSGKKKRGKVDNEEGSEEGTEEDEEDEDATEESMEEEGTESEQDEDEEEEDEEDEESPEKPKKKPGKKAAKKTNSDTPTRTTKLKQLKSPRSATKTGSSKKVAGKKVQHHQYRIPRSIVLSMPPDQPTRQLLKHPTFKPAQRNLAQPNDKPGL
ncbi:unnamed protein product [Owenia fusiformis]|uniref:Nucleoplasmin core domain-containing protein n=1 Tax=Owenia fusiformis TaxID=6347 RepID=A0A8S4NM29_OWEFU|nr:unnamed protein product [Owenia fusiformis]